MIGVRHLFTRSAALALSWFLTGACGGARPPATQVGASPEGPSITQLTSAEQAPVTSAPRTGKAQRSLDGDGKAGREDGSRRGGSFGVAK